MKQKLWGFLDECGKPVSALIYNALAFGLRATKGDNTALMEYAEASGFTLLYEQPAVKVLSLEQQARDLLERMQVPNAQDYLNGEVVELASLIRTTKPVKTNKTLLPCPFCGTSDPEYDNCDAGSGQWFKCTGCPVLVKVAYSEGLIEAWNARAKPKQPAIEEPSKFHVNAQEYMRHEYGAYRGHFAWRELEKAYSQGRYDEQMAQGPSPEPAAKPQPELPEFTFETYAPEKSGGWFVGVNNGVRVTHSSGAVQECHSERSQHANKTIAYDRLQQRLAVAGDTGIAQQEQPAALLINHAEAKSLAYIKRQESNLARCYLDLCKAAAPNKVEPTAQPVFWANLDFALQDPIFNRCRAIMGTTNEFQDGALLNVLRYFLATALPVQPAKIEPAQPESKA